MAGNTQQFYPQILSVKDQPDLAQELRTLRQLIYSLQAQFSNTSATPKLTDSQLAQIQKALQVNGSHPLNTTGLLG